MDVSQLCSNPPERLPETTSRKNDETINVDNSAPQRKTSNIQFLLSPYKKEDNEENKSEIVNKSTSIEKILIQCSSLCEAIWQLKLQNEGLTEFERDEMINTLSESAKCLFKAIQSTEEMSKNSLAKRELPKADTSNIGSVDSSREDDDEYYDDDGKDLKETSPAINDYAEYEIIRQARNIQSSQSRPKYRKRNRRSMIGQRCHSCSTAETPEWRRGPDGARTLCNACGLHYSKLLKKGSITVQTQNYLVNESFPQTSPSNESTTKTLTSGWPDSDSSSNPIPNKPIANFPFVMMDPKYGFDKKQAQSPCSNSDIQSPLPISFDTHNSQLPPRRSSDDTNTSLVNTTTKVNLSKDLSSHTSPVYHNDSKLKEESAAINVHHTNKSSLAPLRIHQWKKHN